MRRTKQANYVVTRQHYYYSGAYVVEVETGGWDCVGPGMLTSEPRFDWLGCDQTYSDPREAARVAFDVWQEWQKHSDEPVYLSWGSTGGIGTEHDPMTSDEHNPYWSAVQMFMQADAAYEALPKCDHCGSVIEELWHLVYDPDWGDFCSEACVELAAPDDTEEDLED